MLNEFKLFTAVNEAVSGGYAELANIPEYNLDGLSLAESFQECNAQIMAEAAAITEFDVGADELIVEAVMTNNSAVAVLSESALDNVWTGLKKIIDKLIAMVKSLITKIKMFFAKLFGKTDAWAKMAEPKMKNLKTGTTAKVTVWEWNENYVLNDIFAGAQKLFNDWSEKFSAHSVDKINEAGKNMYNQHSGDKGGDFDPEKKFEEALGVTMDGKSDHMIASLSAAFGFGNQVASMNDIRDAIIRKAHGDSDTKAADVEIDITRGNQMVAFVSAAKKTINNITKLYQDDLTKLNNFRKSLNKSISLTDKSKDANTTMLSSITTAMKKAVNMLSSYTTAYHSAINTTCNLNTTLIQSMAQDYMGAVSKLIGAKAPKENKGADTKK